MRLAFTHIHEIVRHEDGQRWRINHQPLTFALAVPPWATRDQDGLIVWVVPQSFINPTCPRCTSRAVCLQKLRANPLNGHMVVEHEYDPAPEALPN